MEPETLSVVRPDLGLFVLLIVCPWLVASLLLGLNIALESEQHWTKRVLSLLVAPLMTLMFLVMIILPAIGTNQKLEDVFDFKDDE